MKTSKGCPNKKCKCNKEKELFIVDQEHCSECGSELVFVCKKCYKILDDGKKRYCSIHLQEKKDFRGKAAKIGLFLATVVLAGPKLVKKVINLRK